jgi:hypothetical protein
MTINKKRTIKRELTSKQENFAKAIALQEMNHTEAYRTCYNAKNMKPETITSNAHKLAVENNDVALRINTLKEQLDSKVMEEYSVSKVKLLEELELIKQNSIGTRNKIAIDCIKEQGKLQGYYEDTVTLKGRLDVVNGIRDFKKREKEIEE